MVINNLDVFIYFVCYCYNTIIKYEKINIYLHKKTVLNSSKKYDVELINYLNVFLQLMSIIITRAGGKPYSPEYWHMIQSRGAVPVERRSVVWVGFSK